MQIFADDDLDWRWWRWQNRLRGWQSSWRRCGYAETTVEDAQIIEWILNEKISRWKWWLEVEMMIKARWRHWNMEMLICADDRIHFIDDSFRFRDDSRLVRDVNLQRWHYAEFGLKHANFLQKNFGIWFLKLHFFSLMLSLTCKNKINPYNSLKWQETLDY